MSNQVEYYFINNLDGNVESIINFTYKIEIKKSLLSLIIYSGD